MIETITKEELATCVHPEMVETILGMARLGKPEPKEISRKDFTEGVLRMESSAFATVSMLTTIADGNLVKPKTNGISGAIEKLATVQCVVNATYANMVNNVIGKITEVGEYMKEFEAAPLQWGQRVFFEGKPRGLVEHKGKFYLTVALIRNLSSIYFLRGKEVDYGEIREYFREKKESQRQPLPEELKVRWRTIGIDSLQQVTITPNTEPRLTFRYRLID